ncbi:DUF1127 domain-containing protein [Rhizobium sp. BK602]|uniref:DUF1127 domain-containing protein n=1 Tax=Rhizobium sp. BK602 TaxID=2586986 RepID=UPI0016111B2F|nr:DUF1127 domain-containing protein [Rhizobium sp. BK602]MBB3612574.1 uncharacterized protein YjiS (DUF1127 family) [Rhizobium sp. BK602]
MTTNAIATSFRRSEQTAYPLLRRLLAISIWIAAKLKARSNRNALLELSDDQLKDIGLSRGQAYSHDHIYTRYR